MGSHVNRFGVFTLIGILAGPGLATADPSRGVSLRADAGVTAGDGHVDDQNTYLVRALTGGGVGGWMMLSRHVRLRVDVTLQRLLWIKGLGNAYEDEPGRLAAVTIGGGVRHRLGPGWLCADVSAGLGSIAWSDSSRAPIVMIRPQLTYQLPLGHGLTIGPTLGAEVTVHAPSGGNRDIDREAVSIGLEAQAGS